MQETPEVDGHTARHGRWHAYSGDMRAGSEHKAWHDACAPLLTLG